MLSETRHGVLVWPFVPCDYKGFKFFQPVVGKGDVSMNFVVPLTSTEGWQCVELRAMTPQEVVSKTGGS